MRTEADTCRQHVVPKLQAAGWDAEPRALAEQRTITDGRIVPVGQRFVRWPPKRIGYLVFCRPDFPLAVVEAKAAVSVQVPSADRASQRPVLRRVARGTAGGHGTGGDGGCVVGAVLEAGRAPWRPSRRRKVTRARDGRL